MRLPMSLLAVLLTLLLAGAVIALPGCSSNSVPPVSPDVSGEETVEPGPEPDEPQSEEVVMHVAEYQPTGTEIAVIETSKGVIEFEFYFDDAPNHAASFIELADAAFYDGTKFHRVEPGFVIQGGDPLSKTDDPMVGTGGPGYYLAAEFNEREHLDGTVAMARSQNPDSAGSQFYICLGPQPFLNGQYTVFGQVVSGLDVVHSIEVGDVMESVRIKRAE